MSQRRWLTLSIFTLVCGCLLYIGCTSEKSTPEIEGENDDTVETDGGKPGQTNPGGPKKLLDGWEKPALALIISGEVHGYLEPCGCSDTQSGGLARRADLFRQLKEERGWDVVGLDLGGLLNRDRATRRQSQLKFQALKKAMEELDYTSVGLGPEELVADQGGSLFLYQQWADSAENPAIITNKFSLLSANVQPNKQDEIAFPQSHQIIEAGGRKIAVTSILGEKIFQELFGNSNLGYTPAAEALPPVIEKMQAEKPDLLVLLSNASLEESKQLAEQFPQFQLIVSIGTENPHHREEYVGKTRLITLGHKGKHVAVAGFYPDQEQPIKIEIVDLDKDRFLADDRMRERMREYQGNLRQEYADLIQPPLPHPSGTTDTYVGAEKCGSCHKQAYSKWKTTKHAHAYESLEKGRKGEEAKWVSRIHDPECLACHVTGWNPQEALPIVGGFTSAKETPHLMGQQCENCHGPGSEHTKLEELWEKDRQAVEMAKILEARRSVKQDKTTVEKKVCIKCHDYENSPNFKFDTYWPKVDHKGLLK